jgi:hypothetical protein
MKQGWETSTLLDVEQLWKQKQQKIVDELPKPRFTQRDIIDKRVYIPSPGARHARAKKAKLVRTYSNPPSSSVYQTTDDFRFSRNYSSGHIGGSSSNIRNNSTKSTLYFHHYNHYHQGHRQSDQEHQQQRHDMMDCNQSTASSSCSDNEQQQQYTNKYERYVNPAPPVRNSLDYLSYAIAMTEAEEAVREEAEAAESRNPIIISSQPLPDISEMEPNLMDHSYSDAEEKSSGKRKLKAIEEVTELDVGLFSSRSNKSTTEEEDRISSPSSTVFSAAKTIMMFTDSQP